jgi:2-polyprenyl-6-methoxyphenol hydroxylase-like FAD-dependent oxidoreductase
MHGTKAIIIGGSIAGLLAAKTLSDHFNEVILIERDDLTDDRRARRGVPQGRHAHGILASGSAVLEGFFPGIADELEAAGALRADALNDGRWFFEGGCLKRTPAGRGILVSRPLLESTIRGRVRQIGGVKLIENCTVSGLFYDAANVRGVRVGDEVLEADLVIDASGRGSHSPNWLNAMGYHAPSEETVEVQVAYTTRLFRLRPGCDWDDLVLACPPTVKGKRGGVVLAQENGKWIVTLFGHFGNQAPLDLEGFIEYSKSLPAPFVHEFLKNAEPISDASFTRFPANRRRRYEKLDRFPEGFLVFGDSICSFNPVYGQGMSVAALQAVALQGELASGDAHLARRFFKRAAKVIDTPWSIATGADLKMPEAAGRRTPAQRLINRYIALVHKAAHTDAQVAAAFIRVTQLLADPDSLMRPTMLLRVLSANLRDRLACSRAKREQAGRYVESGNMKVSNEGIEKIY